MTLAATQQSKESQFEELVRQNAPAVAAYLRRRIYPLDLSDVDDVLAETLVTTWRRFDAIPKDAELPWMLGVARRTLANTKRAAERKSRRDRQVSLPATPSAESLAVADLSLAAALSHLSDDEREILLASVWDGLEVADLAALYEISHNAAALRLSRAKARFLAAFHE